MDVIQSKNYKIATYETNKNYLSCFDEKIHILGNGYDSLVFGS